MIEYEEVRRALNSMYWLCLDPKDAEQDGAQVHEVNTALQDFEYGKGSSDQVVYLIKRLHDDRRKRAGI
jgi:hypothetical protein